MSKLFRNTIIIALLFLTSFNGAAQDRKAIFFTPNEQTYDYIGISWSLREIFNWENAVLKIRRSSDNATSYVFFDGSSPQQFITLSSYISTTSNTTPDTTTLGTWVGSNSAYVEEWYGMTTDGIIDTDYIVNQTTAAKQPRFITSGTIDTKNGKSCLEFISGERYLQNVASILDMNSDQTYTIVSVSSCDDTSNKFTVWSTKETGINSRIFVVNDRQTSKRAVVLVDATTTTSYYADLTSQINSNNQRCLALVHVPGNISSYYNGTLQNSTAYSGGYNNNAFQIGVDAVGTNYLIGQIQEITMFTSNKSSDIADIFTEIDLYYSIP